MLYLDRLCIPVGLACDLECSYCYRQAGKTSVPRLTEKMANYIKSLDPKKTYVVVISGGEPLLYWKRAVEIFDLVPKGIYKKIMTNGTHLTQEIVDYLNANDIELHFSHDGAITQKTRGVDVLEDPKILNLVKQVKNMRVHSVIVTGNEDVMANYNYIVDKLGRSDFYYTFNTVYGEIDRPEIIEGFDYDTYTRTWIEFKINVRRYWDRYRKVRPGRRSMGLNVLPDGTVCAMVDMTRYGTIDDSIETIKQKVEESGGFEICNSLSCRAKQLGVCGNPATAATPHFCKATTQNLTSIMWVKKAEELNAKCL